MKREQEKIKKSGFEGFLLKPITRIQLLQEAARFLPHSIVEIPTESSEQSVQDISPESRKHLPELLEQLEEECMELWDAACQSNSFEDIEAFGTQINVLGACYSVSGLEAFGERLLAHARNFDVEQMTIALKSYPAMVEEIRNLIG
jgi:5-methylthioribose kinase